MPYLSGNRICITIFFKTVFLNGFYCFAGFPCKIGAEIASFILNEKLIIYIENLIKSEKEPEKYVIVPLIVQTLVFLLKSVKNLTKLKRLELPKISFFAPFAGKPYISR